MHVLILEPYSMSAISRLVAAVGFDVSENAGDLDRAEVVLIRSRTPIDASFLDRAPRVKLVVTATSGFDHIDWRECQKRGVITAHTPDANAQSTAELAMGLMIAAERDLPKALRTVRDNRWRDGLPRPQGLDGQTLGIIGLGRVGSRVAAMARTFGMKLIAHDPYVGDTAFQTFGIQRLGLTEVLRAADIVTLHVPLTKETHHLINNPTFGEMQDHALLINTCRGAVVDQNDLLVALDDATIRGAAMDVIEREPPPKGHRLLTHPRLLLTPHIGAYTESAWEKASAEAVSYVLRFRDGQPLSNTLPLDVPWF